MEGGKKKEKVILSRLLEGCSRPSSKTLGCVFLSQ